MLVTAVAEPRPRRHERFHPSDDLAAFVEHYWIVEWDRRGISPERIEVLTHPSVHMIFERGACRIVGVMRKKCSRLLEGNGRAFSVKFTPGGFYPFACAPVSSFSNRMVKIHEVFGAEGGALERRMVSECADAPRFALIEEFLRSRRPEVDEHLPGISEMVYTVARDRTLLRVEDLVVRYGIGKRTLQRLFAKYVGATPKWVIQRYRLHEAAEQLAAGRRVNQASLALDLGYSDQAHFVRDFKAIIGISPAAYAKAARDSLASAPSADPAHGAGPAQSAGRHDL